MFTCSVLKDQNRLPPLGGSWTARPWINRSGAHKDGSSGGGPPSPTGPWKPGSVSARSSDRRYDSYASQLGSVTHGAQGEDDMWESMGAEHIADLLTNIRSGFTGTFKTITRSHKQLQRRIAELEHLCERLRLDKEAEEFHSQRLTELLTRETRKTEEAMRQNEDTQQRNQTLEAELAELENLYFRSTELASGAQVDTPNIGPTEDQTQNERRIQELEAQRHLLELNLSLKEPLLEQLQTQVEQLLLDNEMLRAREISPETVHTDVASEAGGSKESGERRNSDLLGEEREPDGAKGGATEKDSLGEADKQEPCIELEVKIR